MSREILDCLKKRETEIFASKHVQNHILPSCKTPRACSNQETMIFKLTQNK